jgi:hypothetical protein
MKMYNQYDKQYSLLLTIFFDLEVCACYLISELLKLKRKLHCSISTSMSACTIVQRIPAHVKTEVHAPLYTSWVCNIRI